MPVFPYSAAVVAVPLAPGGRFLALRGRPRGLRGGVGPVAGDSDSSLGVTLLLTAAVAGSGAAASAAGAAESLWRALAGAERVRPAVCRGRRGDAVRAFARRRSGSAASGQNAQMTAAAPARSVTDAVTCTPRPKVPLTQAQARRAKAAGSSMKAASATNTSANSGSKSQASRSPDRQRAGRARFDLRERAGARRARGFFRPGDFGMTSHRARCRRCHAEPNRSGSRLRE